MKKMIVILAVLFVFILGFWAGAVSFDRAEKTVEEHGSMKTIVTHFFGNTYMYDVEKTSYKYDVVDYRLSKSR